MDNQQNGVTQVVENDNTNQPVVTENQGNETVNAVPYAQGEQVNEEQLRRTYKGIIFNTEEDKEKMIALEKEVEAYCESLSDRSYKELYEKNKELSNLPKGIFSPLCIKIMAEANEREKSEIEGYKARVAEASLEELEEIKSEAQAQNYSYGGMSQINGFILNRRRECQTKILDDMMVGYDSLSRAELKELKEKVTQKNFEANIANQYLNKIDVQYDIVEQDELQSLCANVDNMQMAELEGLLRVIEEGGYQDKYSASYVATINERIEHLQYLELEAMTKDKENMSKDELASLYDKLEQGGYNPKFIKKFLVDVRMLIEKRKYEEVATLTANVFEKSREEVQDIEDTVEGTEYSQAILMVPRKKIADKKFEFEMCELIDCCNDFDSLTDEKADEIIAAVKEKGYSQKSLNIYLDKLNQRKMNIALANVSKLAAYFVQLANKYGVGGGDILVASKSDAFTLAFRNLKNAYPDSGQYDIPAFIMNGGITIAVSYKYCYLNHGNKQTLLDVNNIKCIKTVKKLFMESLVMELKDGSTVPVSGSINKNVLAGFLQMMNEFFANVGNSAVIDAFAMPQFNVEPLNKDDYVCDNANYILSKSDLTTATIGVMCTDGATQEAVKAMHFNGSKDWEQYQGKVLTSYQILPGEQLVFVYDKSLLNNAKEGFALGADKMFIKRNGQPVITVNLNDIFEIKCDASGKLWVETTGINVIALDMVNVGAGCAVYMTKMLDEYVKNMQLYSVINQ